LPEVIVSPLSNKAILWLEKDRVINRQTMSEFKLFSTTKYFHAKAELKAGEISCIGFPYFRNDTIVNCKYRDGKKRFTFEPGAELIAYNENSILGSLEIVIVEGELDVLSVWQSGYKGVISPPNGANLNRNNLDWLDKIYDNFEKVQKIIIAVDIDQAGESLKTDLIRRFGSERVWLVEWPEGCKDANDVLVKYGESLVKKCLSEAKQVPLEGIVDYEKIGSSVLNFYQNGLPQGLSTQWSKFSELFKIIRGEFMVVTGIPSHGKSVWSENYMMQLSRLHDWKFGVCVFESDPDIMALNLIQVLIKKKFFGSQRLSEIEMQYALSFIKNHFNFFDVGESSNTLDNILQKGEELQHRRGRGEYKPHNQGGRTGCKYDGGRAS
jgi:twinkle protein